MKRGAMIAFNEAGQIVFYAQENSGAELPHTYLDGYDYIELPYGAINGREVLSVDLDTRQPIYRN